MSHLNLNFSCLKAAVCNSWLSACTSLVAADNSLPVVCNSAEVVCPYVRVSSVTWGCLPLRVSIICDMGSAAHYTSHPNSPVYHYTGSCYATTLVSNIQDCRQVPFVEHVMCKHCVQLEQTSPLLHRYLKALIFNLTLMSSIFLYQILEIV